MEITTLNLQAFENWDVRRPAIIEYLRSTAADLILFQEVVYLPGISPYNQAQILNETLEYPYIHSSVTRLQDSPQYETYREGLAVLSKYPVVQSDTLVLKKSPEDEHNRIVQLVDIARGDQIVKVANVHYSLTDTTDFATAHLNETLEILSERSEKRIIGGDFNMSDLDAVAVVWKEDYRASTEKDYISYPSMNKRIDYFLVPKAYSFIDISTSSEGLSDHNAVTIEIE